MRMPRQKWPQEWVAPLGITREAEAPAAATELELQLELEIEGLEVADGVDNDAGAIVAVAPPAPPCVLKQLILLLATQASSAHTCASAALGAPTK